MRTPPNRSQPIVEIDGTSTQQFASFLSDATLGIPIVGSGSPEGVVEARLYSLYINSAGTAGAIEYRKMQSDISGDKTQGWLLV